ncbi:MAG: hypothetical protein ACOCQY_05165 [Halorhabdus sp.]
MSDEDHSENRVTVWMSERLIDAADDRVNWRYESRSQYVREAVETRLVLEDALEDAGLELPDEQADREEMVEEIVDTWIKIQQFEGSQNEE